MDTSTNATTTTALLEIDRSFLQDTRLPSIDSQSSLESSLDGDSIVFNPNDIDEQDLQGNFFTQFFSIFIVLK